MKRIAADRSRKYITCPQAELRLDFTLPGGQSFRWQKTSDSEWTGVFANRIWRLSQNENAVFYETWPETETLAQQTTCENLLRDYFQLDTNLVDLYTKWSKADSQFSNIALHYPGVRVLKQDPVENLFSFLCTSNNNIKRITGMVENLCTLYGKEIGCVDGKTYHTFPTIEQLAAEDVAQQLQEKKFGYRAKFIQRTAKLLNKETVGSKWLSDLRKMPYSDARNALMEFPGVGPKVADCICLMSLDKTEAVPVDTHIFKLASHHYLPSTRVVKTLTKKVYTEIGNRFFDIFGTYAGWAHSVLFVSDLRKFQTKDDTVMSTKNSHKRLKSCK